MEYTTSVQLKNRLFKCFAVLYCLLAITQGDLRAQVGLAGLPLVKTFNTGDYKAGIQNWDILQDRRGILYIANNFGLLEYDGNVWENHPVLNGTKVRSVALGPEGRIYVGCQGDFGFFFPDDRGRLKYTSLAASLPAAVRNFDETWSIYRNNNVVYFCTFSRIFVYDGVRLSSIDRGHSLDRSFFVNQQLLVIDPELGLTRLEGNELHPTPGGKFFKGRPIAAILPLFHDRLLIATPDEGIFELKDGAILNWSATSNQLFKESGINCMIRLHNGNFAIGTQNNGLLITNGDGVMIQHLTSGRGLKSRTVLSLYEDDLRNLWIGHNDGLAYVELGSPFTYISEEIGLPGTGYAAFLDDDRLYLGTNTGLYVKDINASAGNDFNLVENTRGQVYHIRKYDPDILMGHHQGAFRIDGKKAVKLSAEPGAWVFQTVAGHPNDLLGGNYSGIQHYVREDGHWTWRNRVKGLAESSRVMEQDNDGTFWMTHGYKGAFKMNITPRFDSLTHISFFDSRNGFASNTLINVFRVRNELLFTSEYGIYRFDAAQQKFVHDDLFTHFLGSNVQLWAVQEDGFGNIYFVGKEYIGVLKKNALSEYVLETNAFNKIRKFLNDDLENITVLSNNDIIIGAKEGFIHYDPDAKQNKDVNFKTLIRKVAVTTPPDSVIFFGNFLNGKEVTQTQSGAVPELPYASNAINFSFTATCFDGGGDLTYQYYLENFEQGWSAPASRTQKEYTNLKEGRYKFHVRARNIFGDLSAETVYEFVIYPPWFRSPVAYAVYVLSVLLFLFMAFRLLDLKHQRETNLIRERQEKELSIKENEFEKLSQKSHEEITRLKNEKLENELRHMNKELATSTMNILNKNEFISDIKTEISTMLRKNPADGNKKELEKIVKDIDLNISSDSDWEQFQFHFDRVHGDFSRRFHVVFSELSPQDLKLSAYLRMNLSTKEIAQLLHISIRGVEISRYRLRKKLKLNRAENLQEFILNF